MFFFRCQNRSRSRSRDRGERRRSRSRSRDRGERRARRSRSPRESRRRRSRSRERRDRGDRGGDRAERGGDRDRDEGGKGVDMYEYYRYVCKCHVLRFGVGGGSRNIRVYHIFLRKYRSRKTSIWGVQIWLLYALWSKKKCRKRCKGCFIWFWHWIDILLYVRQGKTLSSRLMELSGLKSVGKYITTFYLAEAPTYMTWNNHYACL